VAPARLLQRSPERVERGAVSCGPIAEDEVRVKHAATLGLTDIAEDDNASSLAVLPAAPLARKLQQGA
jgi:hypothetical protein